jgi:glycosyltransferase involved in cell wall biosynthesis
MKISIVIPAHNEEKRISRTLRTYEQFFSEVATYDDIEYEFVVVLNGCSDKTLRIVQEAQKELGNIVILDLLEAGKGLAIKAGFEDALKRHNDIIGFVDADMATQPEYFYDLIAHLNDCDGVIASRYMPGARVSPPRPAIKRWGSRIFYEPLVRMLFGISYYDYQCGAKIFKRYVIENIVKELTVKQWAFDIELLYLCKKHGYRIKEIPTTWTDQAGSKLRLLRSGTRMLGSLFKLRVRHL